jgi:hypothetical protein
VAGGDDRRLGDRWMRDRDVLERDRTDPLAARFDDVLGAIDNLGAAVRVDGADITGPQPALRIRRPLCAAVEIFTTTQ